MKLKLLLLYSNLQENTNDRNAKESRENIYVCREPIFPSPTLLREDYDHRRGASCRPPLRNASQFIGGETAFLATTAILSPSPHLQIRVILLLCEHLCPRKGVPGGNSMVQKSALVLAPNQPETRTIFEYLMCVEYLRCVWGLF